jgi:hypothetical protein
MLQRYSKVAHDAENEPLSAHAVSLNNDKPCADLENSSMLNEFALSKTMSMPESNALLIQSHDNSKKNNNRKCIPYAGLALKVLAAGFTICVLALSFHFLSQPPKPSESELGIYDTAAHYKAAARVKPVVPPLPPVMKVIFQFFPLIIVRYKIFMSE